MPTKKKKWKIGENVQGGGYRATTPEYYQRNNANPSYQERRKSMEDTLSKFMSESAKRHEENSNLIKEIRASTDAAIRNQGASIKTSEIQIGQMSKVLQERGFGSLPSSTETNLRDQVKSEFKTPIELIHNLKRRIGDHPNTTRKWNYGPQNLRKLYGSSHIKRQHPEGESPGSFTLPWFINNVCFDNALVDLRASVSVMPLSTYLNLGLGELAYTRSYALSWKLCQGDSLNLPDHRIHKDGDGDASFQLKSDSLPHAHAQTTKTFYKHQDSRIMKAQELKTKTYAQTLIYKIFF
ncbi:hypothetical protein Tco_1144636 [Tanacetum coccineum]